MARKTDMAEIEELQLENIITLEENGMKELVMDWGINSGIYDLLKDKGITLEGLKYMKERHIDELFDGRSLNEKILFEYKLLEWQNTLHNCSAQGTPSSIASYKSDVSSISLNIVSDTIAVGDILKRTAEGRQLIKSYEENGILKHQERTELVHKIIQHYIENDIHLSVSKFKLIAQDIVKCFPTENHNTYFISRGKFCPKGKLWDRYNARKRSLKKLNFIINKSAKTSATENVEYEEDDISDSEDDLKLVAATLKHLRKFDEVLPLWEKTKRFRKRFLETDPNITLQKIFAEWPLYKCTQSPRLIDIDFQYGYPAKEFSFSNWEKFRKVGCKIFEERIKNASGITYLEKLKSAEQNLDSDNVNIIFFRLLHSALVPRSTYISGKRIKFSITDSQQAFTLAVGQHVEVDKELTKKREDYAKKKLTLQPLIVVVGEDYQYRDFYIVIDDIKFKFNSYLEAIEYCFKYFFVMNLKYPCECAYVWIFIQKFLFDINDNSEQYPVIETLIQDILKRE